MYKKFGKRMLDFSGSLLLLFIFSPIIVLITLILLFTNQGKPFFIQPRPGKKEKIFSIVKFKTMNDRTNEQGELLADANRLTGIGAILRKTSLDELPQLFNVLKGEMSFIGPRPLLINYLPYYTVEEKQRHLVRPGITGLSQVKGRNNLPWDERLATDVTYVKNLSFKLDMIIFWKTITKVLTREDIVIIPGSTMPTLEKQRRHTEIMH